VLAALLFTLVFKYGGISLGSVFQLLRDLLQGGLWIWVMVAVGLALFAMRKATGVETGGLKSRISSLIPQGMRGTATLCVVLLVFLLIVTWCFPTSTPETSEPAALQSQGSKTVPEVQSRGLETPSIWHEVRKGPRK
jgi:hypothetical protein